LTNFYVDTSALTKRYIPEIGSAWVRSWTNRAVRNAIIVCDLTGVEVFAACARQHREGRLTSVRRDRLQALFIRHMELQYFVIPVDVSIFTQARSLVNAYPLRSLDAIQLASALHARRIVEQSITFVTADKQLRTAASNEGFTVEDPNTHP